MMECAGKQGEHNGRTCTSLPSATRLWSTPVSKCVLQGSTGIPPNVQRACARPWRLGHRGSGSAVAMAVAVRQWQTCTAWSLLTQIGKPVRCAVSGNWIAPAGGQLLQQQRAHAQRKRVHLWSQRAGHAPHAQHDMHVMHAASSGGGMVQAGVGDSEQVPQAAPCRRPAAVALYMQLQSGSCASLAAIGAHLLVSHDEAQLAHSHLRRVQSSRWVCALNQAAQSLRCRPIHLMR